MRLEDLKKRFPMRDLLPMVSKFLHFKKMLMWSKPRLNPPLMTEDEMRAILAQISQAITTQRKSPLLNPKP